MEKNALAYPLQDRKNRQKTLILSFDILEEIV